MPLKHKFFDNLRLSRSELFRTEDLSTNLGTETLRGSGYAMTGQIYRLITQLLVTAILARVLTPSDFGLIAMAGTITIFVGMFSELGLSSATIQRPEIDNDLVTGLFYFSVMIGTAVMLIVFAISPFIASVFQEDRVVNVIVLLAATIPIGALSSQHGALLQRRLKFNSLLILSTVPQTLGSTVAVLLALYTNAGYWSLVMSPWVTTLTYWIFAWYFVPWRPGKVHDWSKAFSCINFGAYLTGYAFVEYAHRQGDNALLSARYGAETVGYYTRAYGLFLLPMSSILSPLFEVLKTTLSRAQNNDKQYQSIFDLTLIPVNFVAGLLCGLLHFLAPVIIPILYGKQWNPSIDIFQMLSISVCVQSVLLPLGWLYISTGRTKTMFYSNMFFSSVLIVSFILFLDHGAEGIAAAYTTVSILIAPILVAIATREGPVSAFDFATKHSAPPLAALCAIGGTHGLVSSMNFNNAWFEVLLFTVLYLLGIFLSLKSSASYRSAAIRALDATVLILNTKFNRGRK